MSGRKADGPAGSIDAIPIPDELPDDPREAFRMGARAGLTVGYARGSSTESWAAAERIWRQR